MIDAHIGQRIKEERQRLSLNQTEFGKIGGVGKLAQANYEKGTRHPSALYLASIAAAGADVLYVVTGQRTPDTCGDDPATLLPVDEQLLLDGYRALPSACKKRLLQELGSREQPIGAPSHPSCD